MTRMSREIELKAKFCFPRQTVQTKGPLRQALTQPERSFPGSSLDRNRSWEGDKEPISEGGTRYRLGDYSRKVPIDTRTAFETFTSSRHLRTLGSDFGHSAGGPTVTVEDKEMDMELTSRRLF